MFAPRHRWSLLAACVALTAPARSVRARGILSETATATVPLEPVDEVEVPGVRPRAPANVDPSATSTRIDGERLARVRVRGDDVAAVADAVAGARVLDLGGTVAERRVSVRGGSPAQTLIIVDGVRLSSPFATGLDLGMIALESIDSVELIRGGAGAALGAGALTGALVLETRPARAEREEALLLGYGSLGTARAAASARVRPVAITGSFERTAGEFSYVSRIRGLPDREAVRANSDAARGAIALRADGAFGDNDVALALGGAIREGGLPGLETQADLHARERRATAQARASLARDAGERGRVEAGVSAALLDVDYRRELPAAVAPDPSRTRFHTLGGDVTLELGWLERHVARATASLEREASDSTVHGSPSRWRIGAAISDEVVLSEVTVFAAVRGELYSDASLAVLPRAGVAYTPHPAWTLAFGAGRSLRAPAIDELYHPPEPGFSGNPALVPETAWEAELSAAFAPGGASAKLALFGRSVSDTILYVNRNAFEVRPENAGATRAAGAELELAYAYELGGVRLSAEGAASVLLAELEATREPVPTQPRWGAWASIALARSGVTLETSLRALAATTANLQGTLEVPEYVRWDATASYEPAGGATVALTITNLLDDRTLASVHKLPQPGRVVFASLRVATEDHR